LQDKERLYLELKSILARQPGPEAAEQLNLYQVCGWLVVGGEQRASGRCLSPGPSITNPPICAVSLQKHSRSLAPALLPAPPLPHNLLRPLLLLPLPVPHLQASLREKTKQMKSLASELNMYQAHVGGGSTALCSAVQCVVWWWAGGRAGGWVGSGWVDN
jgi:hypothetical protein